MRIFGKTHVTRQGQTPVSEQLQVNHDPQEGGSQGVTPATRDSMEMYLFAGQVPILNPTISIVDCRVSSFINT